MVAKVISGKNIKGALNYNEHKVAEGVAKCIQASGYLKSEHDLSFSEKLARFTSLNERNLRTKTNTIHVSLNFDPSEKLSVDELNKIASTYMDRIGFGGQPYLVYEHFDAAHPHIHIVSTLIQEDGKRIPIHNLGRNQSDSARKEIELEFGLVKASSKQKSNILPPTIDIEKAIYGKSLTKRSIANVVAAVVRNYKYTSLHELNAVLKQFNVIADRGNEKSVMYEKKGLRYSMINQKGNRVGIPSKASSLAGKPTLPYLEKQFKLNTVLRQPHRDKLKAVIEVALSKPSITTLELLKSELLKSKIQTVLRTNAEGLTYGVTFIDHNNRTVFNGSDLGKSFSASALLKTLSSKPDTIKPYRPGFTHPEPSGDSDSLLKELFYAEGSTGNNPEAILRLGRKRRKKVSRCK